MTFQEITSRSNPLIVETGKLSDKKYRQSMRQFCFEGWKLLHEAQKHHVPLVRVFVTAQAKNNYSTLLSSLNCPIYLLPDAVYAKLSQENAPQGVFSCAKFLDNSVFYNTIYKKRSHLPVIIKEKILICDGLRDPGNMGTVIRTADALGFDRLVLSADCADFYSPKAVRGAMGAMFRMQCDITNDVPAYIHSLRDAGYQVYAAALRENAQTLGSFPVTNETVFVIGNEGHGLSETVLAACSGTVIIPMTAEAESLNAAIAAAILMWERQKAVTAQD